MAAEVGAVPEIDLAAKVVVAVAEEFLLVLAVKALMLAASLHLDQTQVVLRLPGCQDQH